MGFSSRTNPKSITVDFWAEISGLNSKYSYSWLAISAMGTECNMRQVYRTPVLPWSTSFLFFSLLSTTSCPLSQLDMYSKRCTNLSKIVYPQNTNVLLLTHTVSTLHSTAHWFMMFHLSGIFFPTQRTLTPPQNPCVSYLRGLCPCCSRSNPLNRCCHRNTPLSFRDCMYLSLKSQSWQCGQVITICVPLHSPSSQERESYLYVPSPSTSASPAPST